MFQLTNQDVFGISNVNDVSDIGIDEKLESPVYLDAQFTDHEGRQVSIKDYIGDVPVVINLLYFSCPRVCNFALDGMLETVLQAPDLEIGKDYRLLSVSFNPLENHEVSKEKAIKYIGSLPAENQSDTTRGWNFLTGDEENILKLTDSLGYRFTEDGEEFAHPTALIVLTPKGIISRYLYGIEHNPKDYRLALLEASDGRIGGSSLSNKVLLFCYQFDPVGKRYALKALNVVKAGGVVTLLALSGFLAFFWIREKKSK